MLRRLQTARWAACVPANDDVLAAAMDQRVGGIGLLLIRQLGSAIRYDYSGGRNRIVFSI